MSKRTLAHKRSLLNASLGAPKPPRSNRDTNMYNAFNSKQLDDMVHYWLQEKRIVPIKQTETIDSRQFYRVTYAPPAKDKYVQAHVLKRWREDWTNKGYYVPPLNRKVLVHVIYWRWANQYKLLDPLLEISHCWKGHTDILYLTEETPDLNDSRIYCMKLNWWHPNYPGVCNHNPPCWGDVNE